MTRTQPRFHPVWRSLGLLAVMLAVAGRLAAGMAVTDGESGRGMASLLDAMIQCRSDAPSSPAPQSPAHHEAEHALCALVAVSDLPSPTLTPTPVIPPRRGAIVLTTAVPPPARGPPSHPPGAALPRGPPSLA